MSTDALPGSARPHRLVVVVGTGTEVGKTWVSCQVLRAARAAGHAVAARKPVQSFGPDDPPDRSDAALLAAASGEAATDVCPPHRWYPRAMAPPMAADELGLGAVRLQDLIEELHWPASTHLGLVETAGGVRSPIAHDGDGRSLALQLRPDLVVLVADAGLGTINAVELCLESLSALPTVVMLNRFDPADVLHGRNLGWLRDRCGHDMVTLEELIERCVGPVGSADQGQP